ncbi:MAG: hypothetical protein R2747_15105 [Pyrinomonadaceae bacterium]
MYPHFLTPYIYKGGNFQVAKSHVKTMLRGKEPGTFAFFQVDKQAMEYSPLPGIAPTPVTMEAAMAKAGGNRDLAKIFMVQADTSQVGLAFVNPQGAVQRLNLNCRGVSLRFNSLNALVEDLKEKGVPVDGAKMIFPAMNYMPYFGDDE